MNTDVIRRLAFSCKVAVAPAEPSIVQQTIQRMDPSGLLGGGAPHVGSEPQGGLDLTRPMGHLEVLRQNATARNSLMQQGAERGGSRAGSIGGGTLGAMGGAALSGLVAKILRLRGSLGGRAATAVGSAAGGGLLGGLGGSHLGSLLGRRAVPDLPSFMGQPVSGDTAGSVVQHLASKISADLHKEAGIGSMLSGAARHGSRFLGPNGPLGYVTRGIAGVGRPSARAAGIGGAALLGGGAVAGGMHQNAQYDPAQRALNPGTWGAQPGHQSSWTDHINPMTWGNGGGAAGTQRSPEGIYRANMREFDQLAEPTRAAHSAATASGNMPEANRLLEQLGSGDFNNRSWSNPLTWPGAMGGLNPFFQTGAYHQRHAQTAQADLQGRHDALMRQSGPQPGDAEMMRSLQQRLQSGQVMPGQSGPMQTQIDALRQRLGQATGTVSPEAQAMRDRMTGAGMQFRGPQAPPPASGPYYRPGPRPGSGAGLTDYSALNPHDFAPSPWQTNQTQQPLTR